MRLHIRALALILSLLLLSPSALAAFPDSAPPFAGEVSIITAFPDDGSVTGQTARWDDAWFTADPAAYNHSLAQAAMLLSAAAYVPGAAGQALTSCGFDEVRSYNYDYPLTREDNDITAHTFGVKRIETGSGTVQLVAVVVKGTSGNEEWYSNFNIGEGSTHRGFDLAKENLLNHLTEYMSGLGLSGAVRYLVTGHSRGAAVANLTAASLLSGGNTVYGYTFATPAVSTSARESGYSGIFNIVAKEDFVTRVPLAEWGYGRYGTDLVLPSRSSYGQDFETVYQKMYAEYLRLADTDYAVFFEGTDATDTLVQDLYRLAPTVQDYYNTPHLFDTEAGTNLTADQYFQILASVLAGDTSATDVMADMMSDNDYYSITFFFALNQFGTGAIQYTHGPAGYYSWLSACTGAELFHIDSHTDSPSVSFKRMTIAFPGTVSIYDADGALIASVTDGTAKSDVLTVNQTSDAAVLDFPGDQTFTLRMEAAADGALSCTLEEISAADGSILGTRPVELSVTAGDVVTGKIPAAPASLDDFTLTKTARETPSSDTQSGEQAGNGGVTSDGSIASDGSTPVVETPETTNPFTDVPETAYFYAAVQWAVGNGITTGVTDTTFAPGNPCTRAHAATFLWRAAGSPTPATVDSPFTDTVSGAYYWNAVLWAVEGGITRGRTETAFDPGSQCTRGQIVTFLYRFAGSPETDGSECAFTDVPEDAYFRQAVIWAAKTGVTQGVTAETFAPGQPCTRGQIITFLYRYFESSEAQAA